MIISRAPVRFSLGGGGTDLPSYANEHGGFLVTAAINKFVYVGANPRFYPEIRLMYSNTQTVRSIDEIEHRLFREALRLTGIKDHIELVSIADVPGNSGLGSSSSFLVALLNALHVFRGDYVSTEQLAQEACHIEMEVLGDPVGKQDQYIAAYGGLTAFTFHPSGKVDFERLDVSPEVIAELEHNLLIFYSGIERKASEVLSEQKKSITTNSNAAVERMHRIKALGHETRRILLEGRLHEYGELLHEHWTNKRRLASNMTDSTIDDHYEAARSAGAIGGKLMGAGGGGFFMFYARAHERRQVVEAMLARGLRPLRFHFESGGARIVSNMHGG